MEHPDYLRLLLSYYEDEIVGEAYFYALAKNLRGVDERQKAGLLARVERRAAEVIRPLLEKYGLRPRADSALQPLGEAHAEPHLHFSWAELMDYMATRYPAYLVEFEALERMAPDNDLPAVRLLTYHEVVTIEFANKERMGDPDSILPIRKFLDDQTPRKGAQC